MNGFRLVALVSRIAGKCRITRILGIRLAGSSPPATSTYCHRYGLSMQNIGAGAAMIFLTTFSVVLLLSFNALGYLCLVISLIAAYGLSTWFYNWIPRKLERERLVISYQAPLVLQEIMLASAGSGSVFDLITLIIGGRHRIVSKAFSKIAERINNGDRPENLVTRYAHYQPCEALRRDLLDAISLNLQWEGIRRVLRDRKGEAEFEYQKYTMQMETRILLIVGLGTFWPIVFSIAVFVNSLWHNLPSMILVASLFIVLLFILQRQLMRPIRNVQVLSGSDSFSGRRGLLKHTYKEELQEVVVIISLLGGLLHRENMSPESAMKRVSETYTGWLGPLFSEMTQHVLYNGETLDDAWLWFRNKFSSPQCRQILGILPNMIAKTSQAAGERLTEVASYVKENQDLIEERENILNAQRFKVKLLSVFSSAALGLIGAISPLFMLFGAKEFSLASLASTIWTRDAIITVMVLLVMTVTNTFNAAKAVGLEKSLTYVCLSVSVFLTVFTLSTRLISGFL